MEELDGLNVKAIEDTLIRVCWEELENCTRLLGILNELRRNKDIVVPITAFDCICRVQDWLQDGAKRDYLWTVFGGKINGFC
jgi:hypothetical protein